MALNKMISDSNVCYLEVVTPFFRIQICPCSIGRSEDGAEILAAYATPKSEGK